MLILIGTGFLSGPAFEHSLARETDFAHRVDVGDHDGDLVAHADVFDGVDAFGIKLRDVYQAIGAGQDFDECAESSMRTTLPV
jgi:hypothetical protein